MSEQDRANLLYTPRAFRLRYRNDREAFIHDCIDWPAGKRPASYQAESMAMIDAHQRYAVRGPRGLGKTAMEAWNVLHFALTREGEDWKAPCTASHWRQLRHFLWPEIHKWSRKLKWQAIHREPFDTKTELLTLNLKLATGEAFCMASAQNDEESAEGAHADNLMFSFDEAKIIPAAVFDSAEGSLSSGDCKAVAMSTPGEPIGRFHDIHTCKPGLEAWRVRHVTCEEAIREGRISAEWVEQCRALWGEASALFQNHCLGEFCAADEDSIIPLAWVEAANERWHELQESGDWGEFTCDGVDVARSGDDRTVNALRYGLAIKELRRTSKEDTAQTRGRVRGILTAYGGRAAIDVIGIGAGVYDGLREEKFNVSAFNAAERTDNKDKSGEFGFINVRSAAWWNLRELLDPTNGHEVALPPDTFLTGDLTAPKWRVMSGAKIQVESKDDIKKRLGRSTDDGDAVVMAFWEEQEPEFAWGVLLRKAQAKQAAQETDPTPA